MIENKDNFELKYIDNDIFSNSSDEIFSMIEKIWTEQEQDSIEAKIWVNKYFAEWRTWKYFLVKYLGKNIWISWYYEIDPKNWVFWLRHHWILLEYRWKWIWKYILNQLIENIFIDWYDKFHWIVEMVPKWSLSIENRFIKMWFEELKWEYLNHHKIKNQLDWWYYWKAYIFKK